MPLLIWVHTKSPIPFGDLVIWPCRQFGLRPETGVPALKLGRGLLSQNYGNISAVGTGLCPPSSQGQEESCCSYSFSWAMRLAELGWQPGTGLCISYWVPRLLLQDCDAVRPSQLDAKADFQAFRAAAHLNSQPELPHPSCA